MATKKSTSTAAKMASETDVVTERTPVAEKKPVVKAFNPNQYVTVRNGFQGKLVYKSPKTGEHFVWDGFGTEQDMEIAELRSARNSAKKYFINNWFMFDDPEVIAYLGMEQYYKSALTIDGFDTLFEKTPDEIRQTILHLSDGQKKSLAYRARRLIADGMIDSNRVIHAVEEALGMELVERQ